MAGATPDGRASALDIVAARVGVVVADVGVSVRVSVRFLGVVRTSEVAAG